MTDPDLKLAREIVTRRIVSEIDRLEILYGKYDHEAPIQCVLEGIKAGRAAGVADERERCLSIIESTVEATIGGEMILMKRDRHSNTGMLYAAVIRKGGSNE